MNMSRSVANSAQKFSKNELCGEVTQTTMDEVYKEVNNRFPPGRFAPELKVMI